MNEPDYHRFWIELKREITPSKFLTEQTTPINIPLTSIHKLIKEIESNHDTTSLMIGYNPDYIQCNNCKHVRVFSGPGGGVMDWYCKTRPLKKGYTGNVVLPDKDCPGLIQRKNSIRIEMKPKYPDDINKLLYKKPR